LASDLHTEIFHASLGRCQAAPDFYAHFYDNFLRSNKEIRIKFEGVDMDRQIRMLSASMQMVMLASQPGLDPALYLKRVAKRHSRHDLDIPAHLYDIWLEKLLQTVKEIDPKYDASVREAWVQVMAVGIQYMRSCY